MNIYLFLSVMIPLAFSPGPANVALANHCLTFGLKKTFGFFVGMITSSFFIVLVISILVNYSFSENSLWFIYMQIVGALYILFLAYKFFVNTHQKLKGQDNHFTFAYGVILNVTNPKFYLMASVLVTQFPVSNVSSLILFISLFILLNAAGNLLWILFGFIGTYFNKNRAAFLAQQYVYSSALAMVSVYLLFEAANKLY